MTHRIVHAAIARVATALTVSTVLMAVACASVPKPSEQPHDTGSGIPATVTVTRQDLTSVLVTSGTVIASPSYLLPAPAEGEIAFQIAPGSVGSEETPVARVGEETMTLGFPARLEEFLVADGDTVAKHLPVAHARYAGFGISLHVAPDQLYRLYTAPTAATALIDSGPAAVECALVPSTTASASTTADMPLAENSSPSNAPTGSARVPALCLLPLETEAVAGLGAKVGLTAGRTEDALVIPVSSVTGAVQQGRVSRLETNGEISTVDVRLGMSDGVNVEITEGLTEGDRVLVSPPRFTQ